MPRRRPEITGRRPASRATGRRPTTTNDDPDDPPPADDDLASDILWGIPEIADYIRRTKRETDYLVQQKIVPTRKHSHKCITGSKRKIRLALQGRN
jgi:hypothetical protein